MSQSELIVYRNKVIVAVSVVLATAVMLYGAFLARGPLLWIAIAGFLAVAINPVVHKTQHFMPKKSLSLATLTILAGLCAVLGIMAWLFLGPLLQQTVNLVTSLPELVSRLNEMLSSTPLFEAGNGSKQAIIDRLQSDSGQLLNSLSQIGSALISILASIIGALVALVAIVSLMFFMTVEGKSLKQFSLSLLPKSYRSQAQSIGGDVYNIINGYVVGNFIISGIFGVMSAVILWLTGSPYFLVLALLVGLIDLIPLVGATIGATLVSIIFVLSGQPWAAVIFITYTIIYTQFESAVLNPAIYSKNVDVSPLTVLVSILIGGAVAGVLGALVAIPVAATLKVVINALLTNRAEAKS
jgi:predicted PurR-regulated permease PerM